MQIRTLLQAKKSGGSTFTRTTGSVIVNNGSNSVDGQAINPSSVTTNVLTASDIYSGNINNSNNITTNTLNANYSSIASANISSLSSDNITVSELIAQLIESETINNSGTITTKDLEVKGTAHFFELIIDKIKAAGGSILISPADGFKIDDVTYDSMTMSDVLYQNCPFLWFKSTDGEKAISNMWTTYDQAICANFNEATVGTNTNISNNYWWYMVGATNNDGNAVFMRGNSYNSLSYEPITYIGQPVWHEIKDKVTGEVKETAYCHFIALRTDIGDTSSKDLTSYTNLNAQIGNDVAMLGHNALDTTTTQDTINRRSAIYLSCYSNFIDTGLKPPVLAHYQGINDFNLSTHRKTYIDASGANIIGNFTVQAGGSSQPLDQYIQSVAGTNDSTIRCTGNGQAGQVLDTIVIQVDSNSEIHNMNNFPTSIQIYPLFEGDSLTSNDSIDEMYLQYGGQELRITTSVNNTTTYPAPTPPQVGIYPKSSSHYATSSSNYYNVQFDYAAGNMAVGNSSLIFKCLYTHNGNSYTVYKNIAVVVVRSVDGTDCDFYALSPLNEQAIVDTNGDLHCTVRYQLKHCVGTSTTFETSNNGYTTQCIVANANGNTLATYSGVWSNPGYWNFNMLDQNEWYEEALADRYYRFTVLLYDPNNNVVDRRSFITEIETTALFSVEEGLTQSIQANSNNISTITQTVNSITSQVISLESDVNTLGGQVSTISQTADQISAKVDAMDDGLEATGIDITNGVIDLIAGKVNFKSNDGQTTNTLISIDPTTGTLNATNANIAGTLTANVLYSPFINITTDDCTISGGMYVKNLTPATDGGSKYNAMNLSTDYIMRLNLPNPASNEAMDIYVTECMFGRMALGEARIYGNISYSYEHNGTIEPVDTQWVTICFNMPIHLIAIGYGELYSWFIISGTFMDSNGQLIKV